MSILTHNTEFFEPLQYDSARILRWYRRFQRQSALVLRADRIVSAEQLAEYDQLILLNPQSAIPQNQVGLIVLTSREQLEQFQPIATKFSETLKFIHSDSVHPDFPQTPWNYYFTSQALTQAGHNNAAMSELDLLYSCLGFSEVCIPPEIIFYPAFSEDDDIQFCLTRISWYLGCIPNRRIQIFADHLPESLKAEKFYDPACIALYTKMRETGVLSCAEPAQLDSNTLEMADVIINWKSGSSELEGFGIPEHQALLKKGKKIYSVDPLQRMESSKYINVSMDSVSLQQSVIAENQLKFDQFCQRIGTVDNAYLFATGPSSAAYTNYDYLSDSSLRIICNSVITDDAMLAASNPQILVFADPIFHFGCSSYARAFRQRLLEVSAEYDFTIMIPIKHYALFCYHMPELVERTIGLPFMSSGPINPDLSSDFYLRSFDNILTFMMLPLGASFAKNLYLIGCDGRPLEEDDYFWVHNKKVQFNAEMETIKQAHPAFFKTDYNEYYLRHCDSVQAWVDVLDRHNIGLKSMWGSFIPSLTMQPGVPPFIQAERVNIYLDPDATEQSLTEWVVDKGALNIVLCKQGIKVNPSKLFCIPLFTASLNKTSKSYTDRYQSELEAELARILSNLASGWPQEALLNFILPEQAACLEQLVRAACQMVLRPPHNLQNYTLTGS